MTKYGYSRYQPAKPKKSKKKFIIAVLILFLASSLFLTKFYWQKQKDQNQNVAQPTIQTQKIINEPKEPKQESLPNIQADVEKWVKNHNGTYSIKITDLSGETLAEVNATRQYFTASIYKLYVAFVGYQKIDDKTYGLNDPYLSGYTRGECLDAMIRDSYSPCGEKMWAELGKENLTKILKNYGLKNTSMVALSTTANDVAIILQNIANQKDLSRKSADALLDSMKTQDALYRRGLPSGFSEKSVVFNKVGWNLDQEWHDTAIVKLSNNQQAIVSVLTTGAGYQNIANLGELIEQKLK
jgi:beta-lactamase class A